MELKSPHAKIKGESAVQGVNYKSSSWLDLHVSLVTLQLLVEKNFLLKLLPDNLEVCQFHHHSQDRHQLVVLKKSPPTMNWRNAIITPSGLENGQ